MILLSWSKRVKQGCAWVLLVVGLPLATLAWSGVQHVQISRAAARWVPAEMQGFRDFAGPMAFPSIFPDLWRLSDPDEGPRHYFEPDRLPPGLEIHQIHRDVDQAFALQITDRPDQVGIAPWVAAELVEEMTEAMRSNDWVWAARSGAAMSHYAADLHMPLHCTRNYNGQETGQHGIHSRIESEMTKAFFRTDTMVARPVEFLNDPFQALLGWAWDSYATVPDLLEADRIATRAAGGNTDTETYYLKLWELTGDIITERIREAAANLASLWYTAWVNAGRPAIPPALDEVPPQSVFSGVGIVPPETDLRHVTRQKQRFDLILWVLMLSFSLVVIVSSLHRSRKTRRRKTG